MRRVLARGAPAVLLLAALGVALPAGAVPAGSRGRGRPVSPRASQVAEVRYLTSTQAYLNRGADDGVKVGMSVSFTRGGRAVGACTVDTVADRWASCRAGGLRKGDRFVMARKPESPPPGPPVDMPSERVLAMRQEAMLAAERELVDFDGASGAAEAHRFSVALGHTTFSNLSSERGAYAVQRLDAAVYDVDVWKGLRVSLDVSVLNFSRRPEGFRAVYAGTPVLLLRQLELGFRRADVPYSGSIGRVWTRWTPGLAVVDGAQAAYRVSDGLEVGAFGGLLPNSYTLSLTTSQWTAGAFLMSRLQWGTRSDSTLLQTQARLGYSMRDELGGRLEVGAAAHFYQGKRLDAHALVELAYGGEAQSPGGVDGVRADVGWRPVDRLRVWAAARYRGGSVSGALDLGVVSPGQRAVHADAGGTIAVAPWLWLGVTGGVASDFVAGLTQGRVGGDVTLPGVLGRGSALAVGYAEELGWLRGRSGWLQATVQLFGRARLLTRTSWLQQVGEGLAANDLAETLSFEVAIFRWLWARASVSGRTQLEAATGPTRTAGLFSVQVGGQY